MPQSVADADGTTASGVSLILNWAAHLPTNR
jgi:hypothetical protein